MARSPILPLRMERYDEDLLLARRDLEQLDYELKRLVVAEYEQWVAQEEPKWREEDINDWRGADSATRDWLDRERPRMWKSREALCHAKFEELRLKRKRCFAWWESDIMGQATSGKRKRRPGEDYLLATREIVYKQAPGSSTSRPSSSKT